MAVLRIRMSVGRNIILDEQYITKSRYKMNPLQNKTENRITLTALATLYEACTSLLDTADDFTESIEKAMDLSITVGSCLLQISPEVNQWCVTQVWQNPFCHILLVAEPSQDPQRTYEEARSELYNLCSQTPPLSRCCQTWQKFTNHS